MASSRLISSPVALVAAGLLTLGMGGAARAGSPEVTGSLSAMLAKTLPMVVNITNVSAGHALPGEVQDGLPIPPEGEPSFGSGYIIDPTGYIATNKHVVIGAERLSVTLHDGTQWPARLIGELNVGDMALIKINYPKPLPTITWGDSNKVKVGDTAIVIGNPLGIGESVSVGVISATNRNIESSVFDHFFQTDAAINHGNSGGAMVDMQGDLIGMNTAIYVPTSNSGSVGLGFAMPSGDVRFVLEQLLKNRKVHVGWAGLQTQALNGQIAGAFGYKSIEGAMVLGVDSGGPAAAAGLRPGDIVTSFSDSTLKEPVTITDPQLLMRAFASRPTGDKATLGVWRERAETSVTLTVADWPTPVAYVAPEPAARQAGAARKPVDLGIKLAAITPDVRAALAMAPDQQGVFVAGVYSGGVADSLGGKPNDILLQVDNTVLHEPADVEKAFAAARTAKEEYAAVRVQRGTRTHWAAVPLYQDELQTP